GWVLLRRRRWEPVGSRGRGGDGGRRIARVVPRDRLGHARPEDGGLVGGRCSRDARLRVVVEREAGLTLELGARDAGLERLDDEAPLCALESERAEGRDDLPRPA